MEFSHYSFPADEGWIRNTASSLNDPSTFRKMWAVGHSFREVFSRRSECSYDQPGRPWFSHLISISKSLYLLIIFKFFKRDVRDGNINQQTSLRLSVVDDNVRSVGWDFLSWLLSCPTGWYSRLHLPHFGMCFRIIWWELHNQAHVILPNERSWSSCYVGVNIQLMPTTCNLPLCGLRFLGPCHRLCNCHRSAFLRFYVGDIWHWMSGPELPWSSFQFLLWALYFIT